VGWEIEVSRGENPHVLKTLDEVTIRFRVDVQEPMTADKYGVALRDHKQMVIWAWETQYLRLESGQFHFCHRFPALPIRPGMYSWLVALWDDGDFVDYWDCAPEMMVATENLQHPQDEWAGVLNLPAGFEVAEAR
jgi:hypothetical protein